MKKNLKLLYLGVLFSLLSAGVVFSSTTSDAKKKNYTITPKSKILKPYTKSKNVNKYTKHYLLLRSYMEKIEKNGGGKLTLKKGTYKISNSVCIPSNTTLVLKKGVKLVKINKTGGAKYKAAQAMFQIVHPKVFNKNKKLTEYNGSHDVKIIGKGNPSVNLKNIKDAKGFVIAHSKNITITGIKFKNMNTGHFIEADASMNAKIQNCSFSNASKASQFNKEAINIDTPDPLTGGLNVKWSSQDRTVNQGLIIENCTFKNLNRAIGTHKYSQKQDETGAWTINCYHTGTIIRNNTFENIANSKTDSHAAIFMMNWKDTTITNNTFTNCQSAMDFRGLTPTLTVKANTLNNTPIAKAYGVAGRVNGVNSGTSVSEGNGWIEKDGIYYLGYKNTDSKSSVYSPIYNIFGVEYVSQIAEMNKQK